MNLYPPGRYRVRTLSAFYGEADNGTPQIKVAFQPTHQLQDNVALEIDGSPRNLYLSLTEGTLGTPANPGWVTQQLNDLGFDWSIGRWDDPRCYAGLAGHVRNAVCKEGVNNKTGEQREEWSIYREQRGPLKAAAAETTKRLNAQTKDLMRAMAKQHPVAAPAPQAQPAPIVTGNVHRNSLPPAAATNQDPRPTRLNITDTPSGPPEPEIPF